MNTYVQTRLLRAEGSSTAHIVELTRHPDLTLDVLLARKDDAWGFSLLVDHPNFTFEWVARFLDRYWDWNKLSKKATLDDVKQYPEMLTFWNWQIITDATHYKVISENPEFPWDFSVYFIPMIRDEHIPFLEQFQARIPAWKWGRFAQCTYWSTIKKALHLPWVWSLSSAKIDVFEPEDVKVLREYGELCNWIKLTISVPIEIIHANPDLPWAREYLAWNRSIWNVPRTSIERCIREWIAASTIKRAWRRAISDPSYTMCRRRLQSEFKDMAAEITTMEVQFVKLRPDAIIPTKATPGAIGLDLHSVDSYAVLPGQRVVVSTGLRVNLPQGTGVYGRIAPRSGLAVKHGLDVGAGVVDPDYDGELRVVLFNHDPERPFLIRPGYRIAQLILEQAVQDPTVVESA